MAGKHTWIFHLPVFYLFVQVIAVALSQTPSQQYVDDMAKNLKIHWRVVSNTRQSSSNDVELTIKNEGSRVLTSEPEWGIYFDSPMMVEPDSLPDKKPEAILQGQGIKIRHGKGTQYIISPTDDFIALNPGQERKIWFHLAYWTVSKTDSFPNWYFHVDGFSPKTIGNTMGQSLDFVEDFTSKLQWKRDVYDRWNPFTPQDRYRRYMNPPQTSMERQIIPQPVYMSTSNSIVTIDGTWVIVAAQELANESGYLREKLGSSITTNQPSEKYVKLQVGDVVHPVNDEQFTDAEAYRVDVDSTAMTVTITGKSRTGVFYGIQTLLALNKNGIVPRVTVVDKPRFEYRGMHVDVGRNFHSKTAILKLLDAMAMYKLNKFHFHLSDDEGWRLEINGLPELTQFGSKRCFGPDCLIPQLGSGPDDSTMGSGFYTISDYQEILRYAADRHIQVIPEFDMPGHARAAIMSMERRYNVTMETTGSREAAEEYRLRDPDDTSKYWSIQWYDDNALNPCLNSTYTFIKKVLDELISLHATIQPLKLYNYGGDEVGKGAWVNSPVCKKLVSGNVTSDDVKEIFFRRVVQITGERGLDLAAWEDGVMKGGKPFNRTDGQRNMYAHSWNNIWEWGVGGHAYNFANHDYKVIMSQATHLYFDHPYEPDPEERGYYWAPRFTNTKKTFSFMPSNLYQNIDFSRFGDPLTKADSCGENNKLCPDLKKPDNIAGMQGHLWSETVRTDEQMEYQIFPRMLAIAERAWHEASWEKVSDKETREGLIDDDWTGFSKLIGERELGRLRDMGIKYRVSPPGGIVENGRLRTNTEYGDQTVLYSTDNGATWTVATDDVLITGDNPVLLKSRTEDGARESRVVTLHPVEPLPPMDQKTLDYIAKNMSLHYEILDNFDNGTETFLSEFTLKNNGSQVISLLYKWVIYIYNFYMAEPFHIKGNNPYELPGANVLLQHVNGGLFRLIPTEKFGEMKPGETRKIRIRFKYWSVAKTDAMPNIYVSADGLAGRIIETTKGENLTFVKDFERVNQWKRYNTEGYMDRFDPFTPAYRFAINSDVKDLGQSAERVIPTPLQMKYDLDRYVSFTQTGWKISASSSLSNEVDYLKGEMADLKLPVPQLTNADTTTKVIRLILSDPEVTFNGKMSTSTEAYSIDVNPNTDIIEIKALSSPGIFYGLQTLLSYLRKSDNGRVPQVSIKDAPRFPYRGMHLDVARNFHSNETVKQLLDAMAMYKLNKFHFHLTDDEGWRLEIPGLEELTEVGSKRCDDMTEATCIIPQLGSGPDTSTSGSGFYTIKQYQDILEYAAQRHIEVIPEFDMPGHAHAAIKAMEARARHRRDAGDVTNADEYLLSDPNDASVLLSVQLFNDNAINPCIESTYKFVKHVAEQVKKMHENINPLKMFNFGGDEVAEGAWVNSSLCKRLGETSEEMKKRFTMRISNLTHSLGLNLAGWEDGLKEEKNTPYPRADLYNSEVYGFAWSNVWEWGASGRAYNYANHDYKVIMAPATVYYFDQPYEPDPAERGIYWATRYTSTRKVFSFKPMRLYDNAELRVNGDPISKEDFCGEDDKDCPALKKPENILGVQGQLWSETVRTGEHVHYMIFPRLLALAERGWHHSDWEDEDDKETRNEMMNTEWEKFSNTMGYGEMKQLDRKNITYRVPPPGAKIVDNKLHANSEIPGLQIKFTKDDGKIWNMIGSDGVDVSNGDKLLLVTMSADGKRMSRKIPLIVNGITTSSASGPVVSIFTSGVIVLLSKILLDLSIAC